MKGMQGGLQQFIKQANQLQAKAQKLQEELAKRSYETTSGGGAVKAVVNGEYKITALTVQEDVLKAGDAEMLQDLVITAVNEAIKQARTTSDQEMGKITGGMSLPGMF
jgi:DNA-binding YbaB/EbfC family protein